MMKPFSTYMEVQKVHVEAWGMHAVWLRRDGLTLKKAGERLGVGRERLRQLESRGLRQEMAEAR